MREIEALDEKEERIDDDLDFEVAKSTKYITQLLQSSCDLD